MHKRPTTRWGAFSQGLFSVPVLAGMLIATILVIPLSLISRQEGARTRQVTALQEAPFRYSAETYQAADAGLCFGETLIYTPTITLDEAAVVEIIHVIVDTETRLTLRNWEDRHTAIYRTPTVITPTERFKLTAQMGLIPGRRYEMTGARLPRGAGATTTPLYYVPFNVEASCP